MFTVVKYMILEAGTEVTFTPENTVGTDRRAFILYECGTSNLTSLWFVLETRVYLALLEQWFTFIFWGGLKILIEIQY